MTRVPGVRIQEALYLQLKAEAEATHRTVAAVVEWYLLQGRQGDPCPPAPKTPADPLVALRKSSGLLLEPVVGQVYTMGYRDTEETSLVKVVAYPWGKPNGKKTMVQVEDLSDPEGSGVLTLKQFRRLARKDPPRE